MVQVFEEVLCRFVPGNQDDSRCNVWKHHWQCKHRPQYAHGTHNAGNRCQPWLHSPASLRSRVSSTNLLSVDFEYSKSLLASLEHSSVAGFHQSLKFTPSTVHLKNASNHYPAYASLVVPWRPVKEKGRTRTFFTSTSTPLEAGESRVMPGGRFRSPINLSQSGEVMHVGDQ